MVKNKKEQFIYAAFVDGSGKDMRISNDISNTDYAILLDTIKKGTFIENRAMSVINTPYKEALLVSRRTVERFDFDELKMKQLGCIYLCNKVNLNKITSMIDSDVEIRDVDIIGTEQVQSINVAKDCVTINKPILNYYLHFSGKPTSGEINNNYYKICIGVMVGELLLLLIIIMLLYRSFTREIQKPIQTLIDFLDDYKNYNDKTVINIRGAKEIVHISTHIQQYIDKLLDQTRLIFANQQKMYEMEILNSEYRFEVLQSQINPHFLYNAINCMHGMAGYYKIKPIMRICEGMSAILRYSLDSEKYVTLSEELGIIEKYVDIMRMRFDCDFKVTFDGTDELGGLWIQKMSLQPFVENAFVHGEFYKAGADGRLEIKAAEKNGRLVISITDNGKGISPERLDILRCDINEKAKPGKSHGLGLRNVNLRIKSEYGKEYGIEIDSRQNKYTCISCYFKKIGYVSCIAGLQRNDTC